MTKRSQKPCTPTQPPCVPWVLAMTFACLATVLHGQEPIAGIVGETSWGSIAEDTASGSLRLTIKHPTESIDLPTPFPNIARAYTGSPFWPKESLEISLNAEATEIELHLPSDAGPEPIEVTLEIGETSTVYPNGRVVLSALSAKVDGTQAKLESHPGNHRIGFWSNADDVVKWEYPASRPGSYECFITYSTAGSAGAEASEVELRVGDQTLHKTLASTGSWYRYRTDSLGKIRLEEKRSYPVAVACVEKRGGAVMNLKAITLVPACEGTMPKSAEDGTVLLHAKDATTTSVLLQWEPRDIKRTLGFWAKADDSAYWDFEVAEGAGGAFEVEILQGCGKGQGGSEVVFDWFPWQAPTPSHSLMHTVKDTGHWQGFEPITIGSVPLTPGKHRLRVRATSKAGVAVMDLREVRLRAVSK